MATNTIKDISNQIKEQLPNAFVFEGTAVSNVDWIWNGGVYTITSDTEGGPGVYGMILHLCTGNKPSGWHWQLAFGTDNRVRVRTNVNGSASNFSSNWTSWRELLRKEN